MPNSRSNGPHPNDAPPWARELSADVRAALQSAAEDRKRADQTAERYHAETVAALQGAAKVGKLIRQDIHRLTQSIDHLARVMRGRSNGQGGGNGRRFKA